MSIVIFWLDKLKTSCHNRTIGLNFFMSNRCLFCQNNKKIKHQKIDPYSIIELKTGYVSLGYNQYYKGYYLFISRVHDTESHKLNKVNKNI